MSCPRDFTASAITGYWPVPSARTTSPALASFSARLNLRRAMSSTAPPPRNPGAVARAAADPCSSSRAWRAPSSRAPRQQRHRHPREPRRDPAPTKPTSGRHRSRPVRDPACASDDACSAAVHEHGLSGRVSGLATPDPERLRQERRAAISHSRRRRTPARRLLVALKTPNPHSKDPGRTRVRSPETFVRLTASETLHPALFILTGGLPRILRSNARVSLLQQGTNQNSQPIGCAGGVSPKG